MSFTRYYLGDGKGTTLKARGLTLPDGRPSSKPDPTAYRATDALRDAANVALLLGDPLLLTGEPGTGKTEFARSLAHELGLEEPLVFDVKSTSNAKDLFYSYDSLRHFHDARFEGERRPNAADYVTFQALGLAILLSHPPGLVDHLLDKEYRGRGPVRSVVLIDEIDKAPRDLPNDVLREIENLSFTVTETGQSFEATPKHRPILVFTSNSEKDLPDAFLRRCVFHHIEFPAPEGLREIIEGRLPSDPAFTPAMLDHALAHFKKIREVAREKPPATAELLDWLRVLQQLGLDVDHPRDDQWEALSFSYSILAKTPQDLAEVKKLKPAP